MNIHRVLEYKALEHLFNNNPNKLIIIMFSMKTCKPCASIRPLFLDLSKKHLDSVFVYIDITEFKDTVNFLDEIKEGGVPQFHYYYGKDHLACVEGADSQLLVETLLNLKKKINMITTETLRSNSQTSLNSLSSNQQVINQQPTSPPVTNLIQQKVEEPKVVTTVPDLSGRDLRHDKLIMLKKLYDLTKKGIKLTTTYNIESDIDDMLWEYNIHTNLEGIVVGGSGGSLVINSDKDYHEQEKQQKINDIKSLAELNNLNKKKQLSCIEQLMQIKKQKERLGL